MQGGARERERERDREREKTEGPKVVGGGGGGTYGILERVLGHKMGLETGIVMKSHTCVGEGLV